MSGLYYGARAAATRAADRFGNWCDSRADGALRYRSPAARRAASALWMAAGGVAHASKLLPRVDAWRLEDGRWRVVYAGDPHLSQELERLLFPAGASRAPLGRVPSWRLRRFADGHLGAADVLVFALPRIWPAAWRPAGPLQFTCPVFVNLVLDISEPLDRILRGRDRRGLRADRNRIERDGGGWHVTRRPADFDAFYHDMYLPHVSARHGSRALVTPFESLAARWIRDGGSLLLISEGGHPVAGVTVKTAGTTCILGEEGILASLESAGFGAGLQTALKCAGIEFAQSLGLTRLVMGRSLARLSDPVLQHKLRWDPVIQPAGRSLHPEWTFTAAHDDGPAIDHLNRVGLLSFLRGRPCLVSVGAVGADRQAMARKVGRALVVAAGRAGRLEEVAP